MSVTTPNITKKRKDLQNLRAKFELKVQNQTPGSRGEGMDLWIQQEMDKERMILTMVDL